MEATIEILDLIKEEYCKEVVASNSLMVLYRGIPNYDKILDEAKSSSNFFFYFCVRLLADPEYIKLCIKHVLTDDRSALEFVNECLYNKDYAHAPRYALFRLYSRVHGYSIGTTDIFLMVVESIERRPLNRLFLKVEEDERIFYAFRHNWSMARHRFYRDSPAIVSFVTTFFTLRRCDTSTIYLLPKELCEMILSLVYPKLY